MIKTRTNFRRLALGFLLVVVSIHVAAQDVNEKSQEPTPVHSVSSDTAGKSGKTIVGYGGLDYYNFDNGGSNLNYWGFTLGAFSYGGGGADLKLKTCFDSKPGSGTGTDLLFNYSLGLTRKNDNMLCLHAKAGPSLMWWTKYKPGKYIGLESDGHKFTVDCILSLGLIGRVGKFAVSGGYNWWFNKFKFKKDYIADGFWVSVSYCINTK